MQSPYLGTHRRLVGSTQASKRRSSNPADMLHCKLPYWRLSWAQAPNRGLGRKEGRKYYICSSRLGLIDEVQNASTGSQVTVPVM